MSATGCEVSLDPAASIQELEAGDRVEVLWDRRGWLPGTFIETCDPDPGEDFRRALVQMDNGLPCEGSGYHPSCVRRAT